MPVFRAVEGMLTRDGLIRGLAEFVVGVIVNLAVVFGQHVFLPDGLHGAIAWRAVALFALAAFALLRLKMGILPLIGLAGLAGLGLRLVG